MTSQAVIVKTYLSYRPAKDSFLTASILLAAILLASLLFWNSSPETQQELLASRESVFISGKWWQLFVSPYVHADGKHFLSNATMLVVLSYFIYGYFRIQPLLILLGPLALIIHATTLWFYPDKVTLLGISGVVYACCGFWIALYLGIDRRRPPFKRLLRAIGFAALMLLPTTFEPQTSYLAHGIGFVVGVSYGLFHFRRHYSEFRDYEVFRVEDVEEESVEAASDSGPTFH